MYRVVGYTWDADCWCPKCTLDAIGNAHNSRLRFLDQYPTGEMPDFNGVPGNVQDREGNQIGAIDCGSEWDYPVHCANCHTHIDTVLTTDGVYYAVELLEECAHGDWTDEWVEQLRAHGVQIDIADGQVKVTDWRNYARPTV